jgi:hypothetical protein
MEAAPKKIALALMSLVVALIPTWFYFFVADMLDPTSFLERIFVFGAGLYFLGFIQLALLAGWIAFLAMVLDD